jgi:hypothetical protein
MAMLPARRRGRIYGPGVPRHQLNVQATDREVGEGQAQQGRAHHQLTRAGEA